MVTGDAVDLSEGLVALPDRLRLGFNFDPLPMLADARLIPAESWTSHFVPQHFTGDWSVVPLRAARGATHPILRITSPPACDDWCDTEFLDACPAIAALLACFPCPLASVRLMRLGSHSQIHEHRDVDLDAAMGMVRLHVPLSSNPDVDFLLNATPVPMRPGECWYLRLADPHQVINRGSTERIHLVIDARVDRWLATILHEANGIAEAAG